MDSSRKQTPLFASVQVFLGGASYGLMATTYKLAYAAGYTWQQVVASQAWFGAALFLLAVVIGQVRGKRLTPLKACAIAKLMLLGALTCTTSILYCYAMTLLPVPVALTLLFQFTWVGLLIQSIMTKRMPNAFEACSALVILAGTMFASGVYETGILGYDPLGIVCAALAAVTCASFVTLSGKTVVNCSSAQRGFVVCLGAGAMSLLACPAYFTSGVLLEGIVPFGIVLGSFGLLLPVLLFGLGTPHLPAGLATIMASSELPAGLLFSTLVLGERIDAVQWAGVLVILLGVCVAQFPNLRHLLQETRRKARHSKA